MFNSSSWQSHAEYHINFKNLKATFPPDLRLILWNNYSVEHEKLMSLNLDPVGEYLSKYYSKDGRPAKNQAQILRSLILFALLFNRTDAKLSLTHWVQNVLPSNIILIALIGCSCADGLPPLGSYYDFMNRLWKGHQRTSLWINTDFLSAKLVSACAAGALIKNRQAQKYRCPMACGRVTECPCSSECSKSSYSRTVYLPIHADLRFSPRITRDSEQYQSIYKERTACERVNNRILNDYHLLSLKIRGDDHYSFWTMIIGVCIHLDAWYKKRNLA